MIHMIGNAHLDPAWMWTVEEGMEAFLATCRSALDRIAETPEFIFTCSSASHYAFVEDTDPALFTRIKDAVAKKRWCVVGGWWVEADCNLPSGESFVRQALLGQQYFASRFGVMASVGYNIDSFGHNANLPQLLRKAGMNAYVFMRPEQIELPLEHAFFDWIAPSGDLVSAYRLPLHYSNHRQDVTDKLRALPDYSLYDPRQPWMLFYGVGNHGGGPTKEQIAQIVEHRAIDASIRFSNPDTFFRELDYKLPTYTGELQPHAIGCYSAHSEIKRLNRASENALCQAERISVMRKLVLGSSPKIDLEQAWKNVCFNQFHDLIGGVAIREACDEVLRGYQEAISIAERAARSDYQSIASQIDTSSSIENIIVFNSSAFDREELISFELWHPHASERGEILHVVELRDQAGNIIPTQKTEPSGKIGEDRARFLARVYVPAFGWNTFTIARHKGQVGVDDRLEYEVIANTLRVHTAEAAITLLPPTVYDDPYDTWAHGATGFNEIAGEFKLIDVRPIERGPLRRGVRARYSFEKSEMEIEIFSEPGPASLELKVFLNWQEKHRLLKLRIPHGFTNQVARYEIPYASIERPVCGNEYPGQTWLDASGRDGSRGVAALTSGKYSYSIDQECINVTCARSPLYAHHIPPHEIRDTERVRYLDQGEQEFTIRILPHDGDWRSALLPQAAEKLNHPLHLHLESRHPGLLPPRHSAFSCSDPSIQLGALKQPETGDGIILRAVESLGIERSVHFTLKDTNWSATFTPFEIKTFLVNAGQAIETDLLERPL